MQALSQGLGKGFNCGRAFEVSQDSEQASVVVGGSGDAGVQPAVQHMASCRE